MSKKRRQFDRAFKIEAVRLVTEEGRPVAAVARDLGIGENLLHRWKQQFVNQQEQAFVGTGNLTPEQDELRKCELRLSDIDMALGATTGKQSKLQDVSLDDITKRMQKLLGNIGSKSDSTISINHTLKRIIPDALLVHCSEISDEVMLNIKGELRPFSLQLPTFSAFGSGTGN